MASAQYFDLGVSDYLDTLNLQKRVVTRMEKSKPEDFPDMILLTEHHPCIVFGGNEKWNRFSDDFLASLNGRPPEEALQEKGIRFYKFGFHGGGAYLAPGHLLVYPINRYTRLVPSLSVSKYKRIIDSTMLYVAEAFGIKDTQIDEETAATRLDIWVKRNGRPYKLGAKGLHIGKEIASHGFQIYVNQSGMEHFGLIHVCGHDPKEVSAISMEELLGYPLNMEDVKKKVLEAIKENFRYDEIAQGDPTLLSALLPDLPDSASSRS